MRTQPVSNVVLTLALFAASLAWVSVGCSSDDAAGAALPYGNETVIVGPGGETIHTSTSGADCIDLPGGDCIKPQATCGDGARADVIVDADGQPVRIVCYPVDGPEITVTNEDKLKTEASDIIVVLDAVDDGPDVADNVEFKGNDVVIYGAGADVSVLGGNLKLSGDRAIVRGIRVEGNLEVDGDGAAIIDCVVGGNLHLKRPGNVVANCIVYGDLHVDMGDNELIGNLVGKEWKAQDPSNTCSDNQAFDDANVDGVIATEELGLALECPSK